MATAYEITYIGCPGDINVEMSFNQSIPCALPNHPAIVAGNKIILEAKIGGITPAILSFRGR